MARALARFTVQHRRLRVRVRLLPTITDVDAEFRAGRRRQNGRVIFGYFEPAGLGAKHVGTIVVPCDADLMEIVPHEVTHAVMSHIAGTVDEEAIATAVGLLTSRILQRIRMLGVEL